jgi:hypothetical protein
MIAYVICFTRSDRIAESRYFAFGPEADEDELKPQPNSIYASKPRSGLDLRRHRKISRSIAPCGAGLALQSRYVSRHATVPPPGRTALAAPLVLGALR